MAKKKRFNVYATVVGGMFVGTYEAESAKKAIGLAEGDAHVSLCHQCAKYCENAEIEDMRAEEAESDG